MQAASELQETAAKPRSVPYLLVKSCNEFTLEHTTLNEANVCVVIEYISLGMQSPPGMRNYMRVLRSIKRRMSLPHTFLYNYKTGAAVQATALNICHTPRRVVLVLPQQLYMICHHMELLHLLLH